MERLSPIAERIAGMLKERGESVAVCESAAGGLISAALLAVPGASAYYMAGSVIYTHDARRGVLGLAGDQVVEGRGQAVDVGPAVDRARVEDLLGGRVVQRAHALS